MPQASLSIPKPCSENWADMKLHDAGRFCAGCQKTVVDFTGMTDRELAEFLRKSKGKLCGRLTNSQLHTNFEIPERTSSLIRYILPISLPALFISAEASSQPLKHLTPMVVLKNQQAEKNSEPVKSQGQTFLVSGSVVDENGKPIPHSTVLIKGTRNGALADREGQFMLSIDSAALTIVVTALGYEPKEVQMKSGAFTKVCMAPSQAFMGEVIVIKDRRRCDVKGTSY
jgi:hypothetical protein